LTAGSGTFIFLETDLAATPPAAEILPQYAGFVLTDGAEVPTGELQDLLGRLGPRLLLASVPISASASVDGILDAADGIVFEDFVQLPGAAPNEFLDQAEWQQHIGLLSSASSRADKVILTRTRFRKQPNGSAVLSSQWLEYAAASFLLAVDNTHSFFNFEDETSQAPLANLPGRYDLGQPQGAMFKAGGVYQRRFARGLVLVNPTSESQSFGLARSYVGDDNNPLTRVTLPPHTGRILRMLN
jgi:hypothetical protein